MGWLLAILAAGVMTGPGGAISCAIGIGAYLLLGPAVLIIAVPFGLLYLGIILFIWIASICGERESERRREPLNQIAAVFEKNGWPDNSPEYLRWANREGA